MKTVLVFDTETMGNVVIVFEVDYSWVSLILRQLDERFQFCSLGKLAQVALICQHMAAWIGYIGHNESQGRADYIYVDICNHIFHLSARDYDADRNGDGEPEDWFDDRIYSGFAGWLASV